MTDVATPPADPAFKFPLSFVLIDHPGSGAPDAATLTKYADVFTKVIAGDFAPEYQKLATCRYDTSCGPDEIPTGMFQDADQPGALGYHDRFFVKVFPPLDKADGVELSSTLLHELLEALEDLTCDEAISGQDGHFWADEPADAVEADTYVVDGVTCTNFVTKAWYSGQGTKYDFLGKLTQPLSVTPGGYAQWLDPDKGWQQITHAAIGPRSYRLLPHSRSHNRRARWHKHHGIVTP